MTFNPAEMKLREKVAIVTGGSRGIGKAIAEFFCREGALVIIFARDRREIAQAIKEIKEVTGRTAVGFACDVSDYPSVRRAVANVAKKFHRIDVLVNAAGIQPPIGPFVTNRTEDWEKNVAINLFGTVHMCHAALPFMMKKKKGSIVNFSGGGATSSRPNFSAYAVAKTGVVRFTEILADELKPFRIRVNAIAPGAVNTKMLTEVLRAGRRAGEKELAEAKKRERAGGTSPELAAALAVFLASSASVGLTGCLVSAVWDGWSQWGKKDIKKIMSSDALKLRRMKI